MRATTSLVIGIAVLAAVATARGEEAAKQAPATAAQAAPAQPDTTAAVSPVPAPGAKVVLRENLYYYDAFNRRDPFRSLIDGAFNQSDRMDVVNLSAVQLVGIVRGEVDRFALLEDASGYSYILRVGDRVHNGSVVSIGEDELVARVTNFGQTTTVRLRLVGR
jgi:Tfp pilus assembly protein PilP